MHGSSLRGKTVIVTRASHQAGALVELLERRGACAVCVPMLTVEPVTGEDAGRLDQALMNLTEFTAVAFTSANAVRFVLQRLTELGQSPIALAGIRVFAIGPATAACLEEAGISDVYRAHTSAGEELAREIQQVLGPNLEEHRILIPRARKGREELPKILLGAGAQVELVYVYDTVSLLDGPPLPPQVDWVTFAGPSAVAAFIERFSQCPSPAACIGPVTARAAQGAGLSVAAIAGEQTPEGLVRAMEEAEDKKKG